MSIRPYYVATESTKGQKYFPDPLVVEKKLSKKKFTGIPAAELSAEAHP